MFGLVFTLLAASSLSNLTSLSLFVDVGSRSRWLPEEVEDMLKNLKCLRTLKLGACGWYTDDFKVRRAVPSLREIELEQWEHEGDTMDMSILSISPEDQATAARLTKLVLNRFEADNDELFSCLVEPCLESLLVLKLGGVLKRRGLPSNALPYAYLHSLRDNVLHVAVSSSCFSSMRAIRLTQYLQVNRSLYLPLERLEISLWKVFEVAADGDKFEAESVDEQQDPANAVPPAPKVSLLSSPARSCALTPPDCSPVHASPLPRVPRAARAPLTPPQARGLRQHHQLSAGQCTLSMARRARHQDARARRFRLQLFIGDALRGERPPRHTIDDALIDLP